MTLGNYFSDTKKNIFILVILLLGPDDELILGFAVRGDRGLIHCY
jgi:hypothetical protein